MKKLIGILLSLSVVLSGIVTVNAETTETLLSTGKPVEAGIDGIGEVHSDTHGTVENIVDGADGVTYDKNKMWFLRSTQDEDIVWLTIDLEDKYAVTKLVWTARYESTSAVDYKETTVYGANEADFSDKTEILNTGSGELLTEQTTTFTVAEENINEYRYIRLEKAANMGGIELQVYGYRNPDTNANLKSLSIEGYSLDFKPSNTEYTVIAGEIPESLAITAEAEADGAEVVVTGDKDIDAGINEITVKVVSPDASVEKTYKINFIVTGVKDISSTCTVTAVENAKSGDTAVFNQLFTSSVKRTEAWIYYTNQGYIDVDLGDEYELSRFEWTKSNLEQSGSITVEGSKTADYAETVLLGSTPALDKESTSASTLLTAEDKFRYIRIRKDFTNAEFLPLSMRIYVLNGIETEQSVPKTEADISANIAGAVMYNVTKGDTNTSWASNAESGSEATPINLFTGSETNTFMGYYEGYIEVDLGAEYNLSKFEWTRNGAFGSMRPVTVYAAKDAEFTEPVILGATENDATSCVLDSENAYRYIRIEKTKNSDWYPHTMRLYALVDDASQADKLSTSITVPARYYAVGDIVIAAVYNDGVLADIETAVVASGETEKSVSVTGGSDSVIKVMIWDGLANLNPKTKVMEIK